MVKLEKKKLAMFRAFLGDYDTNLPASTIPDQVLVLIARNTTSQDC